MELSNMKANDVNLKYQDELLDVKKVTIKQKSFGKTLKNIDQKPDKRASEQEIEELLEDKESIEPHGWCRDDLRKLFANYDQIGPKWSIIQKNFPGKDQIAIKNRFYGTIKKLLRRLFKELNNTPGRKLQQISAQESVYIYLGQKKYKDFKGFLKECFETTNFQISWSKIKAIVQQNKNKVKALFKLCLESTNEPQEPERPTIVTQTPNMLQVANIQVPWNSQPPLLNHHEMGMMQPVFGWNNQSQYFYGGSPFINPYGFHYPYHY